MKRLLCVVGLSLVSISLYCAVFAVVQRPLVVGEVVRQLDARLNYAGKLPSPKLLIFAGSNGRYSHACTPLAAPLGLPCVNASVGVGIGLDFQLDIWSRHLHAGDVVYLPLEYGQYRSSQSEMEGGLQHALWVHYWREQLWERPPERIFKAWFSFDLSWLIQGLLEMSLQHAGVVRRGSAGGHTAQGDVRGHDQQAALAYKAFVRGARAEPTAVPERSAAIQALTGFLDTARERGVLVVGGLPTIPEGVSLREDDIQKLRQLFQQHGHRFVVLANRSQYPLDCFYDALYHLRQECQLAHSAMVGRALKAAL